MATEFGTSTDNPADQSEPLQDSEMADHHQQTTSHENAPEVQL